MISTTVERTFDVESSIDDRSETAEGSERPQAIEQPQAIDIEQPQAIEQPLTIDIEQPQAIEQPRAIDFTAAALYLAKTYGNLITTRDNLRKLLAHRQVFTKDMAIGELLSVTAGSGSEHVQSSTQSDKTARIAEKLAAGYVEKRQKQLEWEAARNVEELAYAEWKIGIVDAAMQERMTSKERWFFKNLFVKRRTYRSIREDNPGRGRIYDRDINGIRKAVLRALEGQVALVNAGKGNSGMLQKMMAEIERERRQGT